MKIVRTLCILSASMVGAGLLSSCATNGHHHHGHHHPGHHHPGHHHHVDEPFVKKGSNKNFARQQQNQKQWQQTNRRSNVKSTKTSRRNTGNKRAANSSQKRYAMSFDDVKAKARIGDADAQYALGYMYYYGQDVERNADKAKFWIRKAAAQGQKRAMTALKMLGESTHFAHNDENISDEQSRGGQQNTINTAQRRPVVLASNNANTGRGNQGYSNSRNFRKANQGFSRNTRRKNQRFVNNANARRANQGFANAQNQRAVNQANNAAAANQGNAQGFNHAQNAPAFNQANANANQNAGNQAANPANNNQQQFNQRPSGVSQNSSNTADKVSQRSTQSNDVKQQRHKEPAVAKQSTPTRQTTTSTVASNHDLGEFSAKGAQLTSGEKILLSMPNDHYTLQLFGARKVETAEKIIADNNLDSNAKIYHSTFKDKDWFVLVYGDFRSPSEALAAVGNLPSAVQKLKPWVKPIAAVKESIRTSLIG